MGIITGLTGFWVFFLGRMHALEQPAYGLNELSGVGEDFMHQLLERRILIKSASLETVLDSKSRELRVCRTENGIIGVDESDDVPRIVELNEADVTQFSLGEAGLAAEVCLRNGISPIKSKRVDGLLRLGVKMFSGIGAVPVFLALGAGDASGAERAMLSLLHHNQPMIVVFPTLPDVDRSGLLRSRGVHFAALGPDFVIHFPSTLEDPRKVPASHHRELIDTVEAGFTVIKNRVQSLKDENIALQASLSEQLQQIGAKVEPEFLSWVITILAAGSVSRAAKRLGIPNSSFDEKVKKYATRGGAYQALFSLIRIRQKGLGKKKVERFNDDWEDHQPENFDNDQTELLRDLIDALNGLNAKNWSNVRDEMREIVCEALGM